MMSDWSFQTAVRTLCQEARGEPPEGQQAVAHVIINRWKTGRWGKSLASVCLWRAQFSGWYSPRGNPPVEDPNFAYASNLSDHDATLNAMSDVLQRAMESSEDPTGGALFYYAASIPAPEWSKTMQPCGKFGHQLFFKEVEKNDQIS